MKVVNYQQYKNMNAHVANVIHKNYYSRKYMNDIDFCMTLIYLCSDLYLVSLDELVKKKVNTLPDVSSPTKVL